MENRYKQLNPAGRVILDLDAIAVKSLVPADIFQQVINAHQLINALVEPVLKAIEAFKEHFQAIIRQVREAIEQFTKPLTFLLTTQPIYLVQPRYVSQDKQLDRYLSIETDPYGFFIIAGKKWSILHPSSSRCGKLLAFLLERRSQVVDYDTLRSVVGAGNLEKDFKDLKYQLKRRGIKLDYARPRSYGIALNGLQALQ